MLAVRLGATWAEAAVAWSGWISVMRGHCRVAFAVGGGDALAVYGMWASAKVDWIGWLILRIDVPWASPDWSVVGD